MELQEKQNQMSSVYTLDIVRVKESDIPQLYDLLEWRRAGEETEMPPQHTTHSSEEKERFLAIMRDHIRSENLFVWAVRFKKWFVGYISVATIIKPDPRVYFYIDELWVPKPFRRRGIASCLLQTVIQTAKTMNLWAVRLVSTDTIAAQSLYRKAGFRVDEQSGWGELKLEKMT